MIWSAWADELKTRHRKIRKKRRNIRFRMPLPGVQAIAFPRLSAVRRPDASPVPDVAFRLYPFVYSPFVDIAVFARKGAKMNAPTTINTLIAAADQYSPPYPFSAAILVTSETLSRITSFNAGS